MTIDANQQRYGALTFDHMSPYQNQQPHFTNPWASSTSGPGASPSGTSHGGLFVETGATGGLPHLNLNGLSKHPQQAQHHPGTRTASTSSNASMASYGALPVTTASAGSSLLIDVRDYGRENLQPVAQDLLSMNRMQHPTSSGAYAETAYTTAGPVPATYAPTASYEQMGYAPPPMRSAYAMSAEADHARRYSQQSVIRPC